MRAAEALSRLECERKTRAMKRATPAEVRQHSGFHFRIKPSAPAWREQVIRDWLGLAAVASVAVATMLLDRHQELLFEVLLQALSHL